MDLDPVKGDRVSYNGRKAVVTSVHFNYRGERICEIEYEDFTQGSFYDEVLSDSLTSLVNEPPTIKKRSSRKSWIDSDKFCQICETKWTITKFGNNTWYDCKVCNKTKEQIMKE
jgi:hypothetical protein